MTKQLVFTCRPPDRGGTTCEATGFEGRGCTGTIQSFVEGMGSEIEGDPELKDEYHMQGTDLETEIE